METNGDSIQMRGLDHGNQLNRVHVDILRLIPAIVCILFQLAMCYGCILMLNHLYLILFDIIIIFLILGT